MHHLPACNVVMLQIHPGLGVTPLPARTAFGGLALPAGAAVTLEVVAAHPKG